MSMTIVRNVRDLDRWAGGAFVPTMGALHEGHGSLISIAAGSGLPAVVSIFVNPTQFAPHEDLDRYPRTPEADLELAARHGAAVCWFPSVEDLYPSGLDAARREAATLALPAVAREPALEDAIRPGHFAGVVQVVARLFDLCRPRRAIFGEKDFQQLRVIEGMVEEERQRGSRWGDLSIVRGPTIREPGGLAMSSRNRYLSAASRERAIGLRRALQVAHAAQRPETAERLMQETLLAHELEVQYAVVRDAETLRPVSDLRRPTRALIAARLPEARLIDNSAMTIWR